MSAGVLTPPAMRQVLVNLVVGTVLSTYIRQKMVNDGINPHMAPEEKQWKEIMVRAPPREALGRTLLRDRILTLGIIFSKVDNKWLSTRRGCYSMSIFTCRYVYLLLDKYVLTHR
jgi:hypothetical protein